MSIPAYLSFKSEDGNERKIFLTKSKYTIGRKASHDIVLQSIDISKHHASIEKVDDGYIIIDHDSQNGTFVNGNRINHTKHLKNHDLIQLGSISLKFNNEQEITLEKGKTNRSYASATLRRMVEKPKQSDKHLGLVTILPSEKKFEETMSIRKTMDNETVVDDFLPVESIKDEETLRVDYEKLRLAYELSKTTLTDVNDLLESTLEQLFSVLEVDRGVIMLVDRQTAMLTIDKVKLREGKGVENKEILLSHTVLKEVFSTKKALFTNDAFEDPILGKSVSIARGNIRSVLCVPIIAHDDVLGILHLDTNAKLNAFSDKDMSLVKTICNQAAIVLENCNLVKDIEKEVTIREILGRFMPPHVVEKVIKKGEEPVRKGGRQTVGTILFADIRGFTNLSEKSSPEEIVDLLNDFFERLANIVFKYDGVLDKYIGDCLMADFGTLPEQKDAELKAVTAALEFQTAIKEMNEKREKLGKDSISIGIGMNTGNLVAGYMGSSKRLEYTCIGDTVNTASRICSMANENQVLISEFTLEAVKNQVEVEFVGKKIFKGKTTEISVYQVLGLKPGIEIAL